MRLSLRLLALGTVLALGAVDATGALAADKEQVIKDRQAVMKSHGANLGAIKGYLDGKVDQAKAAAAAADLVQSLLVLSEVFPPGTAGPNPEGTYAARPEVWTDWDTFNNARAAAAGKADALMLAVKGGDKEKIQAAFAEVVRDIPGTTETPGACGGCHGKFREALKK